MSSAFYGVVVPQIYKLVQEGRKAEITDLWIKVGRYQFYILFFIWAAFLIFGKSFVYLWAGHGYDDAYWVAIILVTPIVIHLCQVLAMEILRAYNKHPQWVLVHLLFSIAGFVICIPFSQRYGAVGVAIGTGINAFLVCNIYDNWYYYKAGNLDVFKFFRNFSGFLPASVLIMIFGGILSYNFEVLCWHEFFVLISVFTIVYIVVMYFLGMNIKEKEQIRALVSKIKIAF